MSERMPNSTWSSSSSGWNSLSSLRCVSFVIPHSNISPIASQCDYVPIPPPPLPSRVSDHQHLAILRLITRIAGDYTVPPQHLTACGTLRNAFRLFSASPVLRPKVCQRVPVYGSLLATTSPVMASESLVTHFFYFLPAALPGTHWASLWADIFRH